MIHASTSLYLKENSSIVASLILIAILSVLGVVYPPYSAVAVIASVLAMAMFIPRPDIALAFYFGIETLFSEDVLLVTEMLAQTIYRVHLPVIGLNVFEVALIILILLTLLQRKGRIAGTQLDVAIWGFAIACLVGYITCLRLYGDSSRLFEPRRLLHFFIPYFLTVNLIRTKQSLQALISIFFIAVILKSIEGTYLYLLGEGFQIKWRIRAIFTGWEDSLTFMTFLLFMVVIWLEKVDFPLKRLYFLFSPIVFFCFLFSYKRAYYVAIFVGLMVVFWIQGKKARMRFLALVLVGFVLMLCMITVMGQWQAIGMRFESILNPTKESSANYRLIEWQNALISIKKNPVLGIGLGGVMPMEIFLSRTNLLGVHNTFLWVAVKMGLLGLFTYLLLHFVFIRRVYIQNDLLQDAYVRCVSRGVFCSFIAFCAAEMFAPMFAQMRTATWLGIMMGLSMNLPLIDQKLHSVNRSTHR